MGPTVPRWTQALNVLPCLLPPQSHSSVVQGLPQFPFPPWSSSLLRSFFLYLSHQGAHKVSPGPTFLTAPKTIVLGRKESVEGQKRGKKEGRKSDDKGEKETVGTRERGSGRKGGEGKEEKENRMKEREKRGERKHQQLNQDYSLFSKSALFCHSSSQVLLE